jgi:hypothetical protein
VWTLSCYVDINLLMLEQCRWGSGLKLTSIKGTAYA